MSDSIEKYGDAHVAAAPTAMAAMEQSRAIQEVQAAFVIAQNYPRDEVKAEHKIVNACRRPELAEQAEYAYPRGGQQIVGPSIRLAETCARYWGNLQYGVRELRQAAGVSEMEAYCHDVESNVRAVRVFHVKHVRHTRQGSKDLTDPRDIYENNANQGARRLRACILEVIPDDVVRVAREQCGKTLAGQSDKPLIDRVKAMVEAFAVLGVTQTQIEERMLKKAAALLEPDLVQLRRIYNSLKDGMSKPEQWFGEQQQAATADDLKKRLKEAKPAEQDSDAGEVPFGGDGEPKTSLREEVAAAAERYSNGTNEGTLRSILLDNKLPEVSEMKGGPQLRKALNVLLDALAELEG